MLWEGIFLSLSLMIVESELDWTMTFCDVRRFHVFKSFKIDPAGYRRCRETSPRVKSSLHLLLVNTLLAAFLCTFFLTKFS